jgi:integrase
MASTRERNGKYTGLYRDMHGAQKSAGTFKTEAAALKAAKAAEALEQQGICAKAIKPVVALKAEVRGKMTVAGYFPGWLENHDLEHGSRISYSGLAKKHILPTLGNKALPELTSDDVKKVKTAIKKQGLSDSTVNHVIAVLSEMFKSAVKARLMADNPAEDMFVVIKDARKMRILTPAEYRRLLEVILPYYALLVECLVSTGLRWSEAMGLQAGDITPRGTGYVITVNRVAIEVEAKCSVRNYGKSSNAYRQITISRTLGEKLLESGKSNGGYVFRARQGGWVLRSNFRRVWVQAQKQAGLEGIRVHDMRHTHASWMANDPKMTLAMVRDRLGHANIATTSRYVHVVGDDDPAVDAMERALAA